jgi:hypothetical protein
MDDINEAEYHAQYARARQPEWSQQAQPAPTAEPVFDNAAQVSDAPAQEGTPPALEKPVATEPLPLKKKGILYSLQKLVKSTAFMKVVVAFVGIVAMLFTGATLVLPSETGESESSLRLRPIMLLPPNKVPSYIKNCIEYRMQYYSSAGTNPSAAALKPSQTALDHQSKMRAIGESADLNRDGYIDDVEREISIKDIMDGSASELDDPLSADYYSSKQRVVDQDDVEKAMRVEFLARVASNFPLHRDPSDINEGGLCQTLAQFNKHADNVDLYKACWDMFRIYLEKLFHYEKYEAEVLNAAQRGGHSVIIEESGAIRDARKNNNKPDQPQGKLRHEPAAICITNHDLGITTPFAFSVRPTPSDPTSRTNFKMTSTLFIDPKVHYPVAEKGYDATVVDTIYLHRNMSSDLAQTDTKLFDTLQCSQTFLAPKKTKVSYLRVPPPEKIKEFYGAELGDTYLTFLRALLNYRQHSVHDRLANDDSGFDSLELGWFEKMMVDWFSPSEKLRIRQNIQTGRMKSNTQRERDTMLIFDAIFNVTVARTEIAIKEKRGAVAQQSNTIEETKQQFRSALTSAWGYVKQLAGEPHTEEESAYAHTNGGRSNQQITTPRLEEMSGFVHQHDYVCISHAVALNKCLWSRRGEHIYQEDLLGVRVASSSASWKPISNILVCDQ